MNMTPEEHAHPEFELFDLEIPLPQGEAVIGYTLQLKIINLESGATDYFTQQSREINDVEAYGMVGSHYQTIKDQLRGKTLGVGRVVNPEDIR